MICAITETEVEEETFAENSPYYFATVVQVLLIYSLFEFTNEKKDVGDKANGFTSPPNDAIIWPETWDQFNKTCTTVIYKCSYYFGVWKKIARHTCKSFIKLTHDLNALNPNIHIQILQTDLHTFP